MTSETHVLCHVPYQYRVWVSALAGAYRLARIGSCRGALYNRFSGTADTLVNNGFGAMKTRLTRIWGVP